MDANIVESLKLANYSVISGAGVFIDTGSQGYKPVYSLFEVGGIYAKSVEHCLCSKWESNPGDFILSGNFQDLVDEGRRIIFGELKSWEVPAFGFRPITILGVRVAIAGATSINHENVVAVVNQLKGHDILSLPICCRCLILDPHKCILGTTVPDNHREFAFVDRSYLFAGCVIFTCDSKHGEGPAVFRFYSVGRPGVLSLIHEWRPLRVSLSICSSECNAWQTSEHERDLLVHILIQIIMTAIQIRFQNIILTKILKLSKI